MDGVHAPMTRNTAKSKRTRQHILAVALPIFAKSGYSGASVRKIAGMAEVNVATLAYHFVDKDGLYDTVIERLYEELAEGLTGLDITAFTQLRQVVEWAWAFSGEHREHIRLLIRHSLDHEERPRVLVAGWSDSFFLFGESVVLRFRPDWSRAQCRMLVLALQHLMARFAIEERVQLNKILGGVEDIDEVVIDFFVSMLERELGMVS
jgi:AcrR family transcriptional regulator